MSSNNSPSRRAERRRQAILANPTALIHAQLLARVEGRKPAAIPPVGG